MYITNDAFHPNHLVTIIQDKNDISSSRLLGYGVYNNHRCPIIELIFKDGFAVQVFDEYNCLQEF